MQSTLSRRAFIQNSTLVLGGLASGSRLLAAESASPRLRVGLMTDIHYADKPTRGSRHYQDSLAKLGEAVAHFNDEKPAFVTTLGDLIDSGDDFEKEVAHVQTVERVLNRLRCERHYVLGNHCVDGLTKGEFIENTALDQPHVAFDAGGFRFIIL
ncbi:MAG: metallophosphoesterase, partial [Phycisphaeraceae bacterium]